MGQGEHDVEVGHWQQTELLALGAVNT